MAIRSRLSLQTDGINRSEPAHVSRLVPGSLTVDHQLRAPARAERRAAFCIRCWQQSSDVANREHFN